MAELKLSENETKIKLNEKGDKMLESKSKGTSYFETLIHLFKANVGPGEIINCLNKSVSHNKVCYFSLFCHGRSYQKWWNNTWPNTSHIISYHLCSWTAHSNEMF